MPRDLALTILKVTDAWDWIAEADNLLRMGRALTALGHRVVVACAKGSGLAERAPAAGLETHVVPGLHRRKNPLAFLRAAASVRRLVAELSPEVVHAYRSPPHLMALYAARSRPRVKVVRTRATMVPPRANAFNRRLHAATERTIVSAESVKALCIAAGFDASRISVVYGGLELERFDPAAHDKASAKRALGLPADALVVGHLARLAPVKGHEYLIAAFREVAAAHPQARLVLAGRALPGMREAVEGWIAGAGLRDRVTVLGEVADVAATIAAFDVGVVSSVGSEAFSRAALEYMAMGVPVVATRVGTLPELVADGVTGVLVPPADAPPLARGISSLLADPAQRAAAGSAARTASARYGAAAQAARLATIYDEIVGR